MKNSGKTLRVLGAVGLLMVAATVAQADTASLWNGTSPAPNDSLSWTNIQIGGVGSPVSPSGSTSFLTAITNGSTLNTVGGDQIALNFGYQSGGVFILGANWDGSDTAQWGSISNTSDPLMGTNNVGGSHLDSIALSFNTPIQAFGALVQDATSSQTSTYTITANFTAASGGGSSVQSVAGDGGDDPVFLGLYDPTGKDISSIVISAATYEDFVIGPGVLIDGTGTVVTGGGGGAPEPGSLLLLASGLVVLGWKVRKQSRG